MNDLTYTIDLHFFFCLYGSESYMLFHRQRNIMNQITVSVGITLKPPFSFTAGQKVTDCYVRSDLSQLALSELYVLLFCILLWDIRGRVHCDRVKHVLDRIQRCV